MLVINVIPPNKTQGANEVHYLDVMKKTEILEVLESYLTYPGRYILAKAEAVKTPINSEITAKDMITLSEYLMERNIDLNKADYAKVAQKVTKLYKQKYLVNPRQIVRPNDQGVYNKKAYGYAPEDLGLIDEALTTVIKSTKVS